MDNIKVSIYSNPSRISVIIVNIMIFIIFIGVLYHNYTVYVNPYG